MSKTLYRVTEGFTYAGDSDLAVMTCPICFVTYAIPDRMKAEAQKRGEGKIQWFCPNGHQLGYHGESETEKRARKAEQDAKWYRERFNAERDLHRHTEKRLSAQKAATTKAKKRHAAALCPCCNRPFVQLRRHMESKHPDYDPTKP